MLEDNIAKAREELVSGGFGNGLDGEAASSAESDAAVADFISSFGSGKATPYKGYDWTVQVPSGRVFAEGEKLYGLLRPETESAYIIDAPTFSGDPEHLIGCAGPDGDATLEWSLAAVMEEGRPVFSVVHRSPDPQDPVRVDYPARAREYDTVVNLFSRNTGLLESSIMLDKTAVLIGVGSVGSFAAMELARSGVGRFVLIDTDTLEIHNICRHQCGFEDLGRYKVDAVRDRILNINPHAEVLTYRLPVQRVPKDELKALLGRDTIIIGGGDNRASAEYGCLLACETDSTFVATCCWTRAFAGEVFYWQSGHGLSCYRCALGGLVSADRPDSHANYFGEDGEEESLAFEPGVAADIDFVTIVALKAALDLLNRDNPGYTPRVINHLRQYTWICNTNEVKVGGERAAMFTNPLQITTTLKVHRDGNCPYCGDR